MRNTQNKRFKSIVITILFVAFIFTFMILSFATGYRSIGGGGLKAMWAAPSKINLKAKTFFNGVEDGMNSGFWSKEPFINIYGGIQRFLGKTVIEDANPQNTVYKMKNGQLTFLYPECDVTEFAKFFATVNSFAASIGTEFLYIQAPFKISKYEDNPLPGFVDTVNLNADRMVDKLMELDVPVLDLRDLIHESGVPHKDFFYNTDHHWTTEAGFWAYAHTMDHIKESNTFTSYNIDHTTDLDNFSLKTSQQSFLGAEGRRIGRFYAGLDNHTLLLPKFATDYKIQIINHKGITTTTLGPFDVAFIDQNLAYGNSSVWINRYASYLGGDYPFIKITNNSLEHSKILIIQDSFGLVFSPFVSLNFFETHIVDPRHFSDFDLKNTLTEEKFDYVFVLFNPSRYTENGIETIFANIPW